MESKFHTKDGIFNFSALAADSINIAESKGHHENWNTAEKIALMHSELSEMLEADRHGNPPSDHIPEYSGMEEELADLILRAIDFANMEKLRLIPAMIAKNEYNRTRPYKHGKKY